MARRLVRIPELPETLVATPAALDDCLAHLDSCRQIAFDTEFIGEDSFRPELCLVQVATHERLFVIDPYGCGPLERFWTLLADPHRLAVVHAGREEIRMCQAGIGRPPAHLFDVQIGAGLIGLTYPIGYAGLVQEILAVRLSKAETLTDWRRRPLSPNQLSYAYDDVRFLLPIWKRISDRLSKLGRADWAAEEFAAAVRRATGDDGADAERWRKVKGLGGMDRRGLAVAREIVRWRDRVAERQNRPSRTVLRDDLIVELSRRIPKTVDDLTHYRGIPRGEGPELFQTIRHAASSPSDSWPQPTERDFDPPHVTLLGQFLGIVLTDYCTRESLAPNLVATVSDLRAVVRSRQPGGQLSDDIPLASGWRARVILPLLQDVLDGKRSVKVIDPTAENPLGLAST